MKTVVSVVVVAVLFLTVPVAEAQQSDGPQFTVAPYFLFPFMTGNVTLRGRDLDVDASPTDIAEKLDAGVMGYFEVRNAGWAFEFDGLYAKLSDGASLDTAVGTVGVEVEMSQGIYELTGAREVSPWADVVFGARINRISGSFETLLLPISAEDTKTWVDPLVGTRLVVPDTGRWLVEVRADIGGFGAGSDFAWHVFPTVGFSLADWFWVTGGYRAISMDYQTGEGTSEFRYDVTTHGPVVGAAFRF